MKTIREIEDLRDLELLIDGEDTLLPKMNKEITFVLGHDWDIILEDDDYEMCVPVDVLLQYLVEKSGFVLNVKMPRNKELY